MRNMVNKMRDVQTLLDSRIHGLGVLSLNGYLFFVSSIFLITGFMLFFYSILMGVNPWYCTVTSSCIFYLVMGFLLFFVFSFSYFRSKQKKSGDIKI